MNFLLLYVVCRNHLGDGQQSISHVEESVITDYNYTYVTLQSEQFAGIQVKFIYRDCSSGCWPIIIYDICHLSFQIFMKRYLFNMRQAFDSTETAFFVEFRRSFQCEMLIMHDSKLTKHCAKIVFRQVFVHVHKTHKGLLISRSTKLILICECKVMDYHTFIL